MLQDGDSVALRGSVKLVIPYCSPNSQAQQLGSRPIDPCSFQHLLNACFDSACNIRSCFSLVRRKNTASRWIRYSSNIYDNTIGIGSCSNMFTMANTWIFGFTYPQRRRLADIELELQVWNP